MGEMGSLNGETLMLIARREMDYLATLRPGDKVRVRHAVGVGLRDADVRSATFVEPVSDDPRCHFVARVDGQRFEYHILCLVLPRVDS
jgi:hypothetical protein